MRTFIHSLFIILLLLQTGGLLLIYKAEQGLAQYKMQQMLERKSSGFEELSLTFDEFREGRVNAREISYKGEMYDVKSVTTVGGKIIVKAIKDSWEKEIIRAVRFVLHGSSKEPHGVPVRLIQLMTQPYLQPEGFGFPALQELAVCHLSDSTQHPLLSDSEVTSPPPEQA